MTLIEKLAKKYRALSPELGERGRRLWAGAEADSIGRGGIAWVAKATGLATATVGKGRDEVRSGAQPTLIRERAPGGGRHRLEEKDPELIARLDALIASGTRGDPESPLRWTCKSLRVLGQALGISPNKVGQLLRQAGYSLQANTKTKEGSSHPDRNAQFELISAKSEDFMARGLPVISVDAKKKELVGEHSNAGREWRPRGEAVEVLSHDFVSTNSPRAIPYGIYDIAKNVGFVNVGTDHNTPTFAVRSIEKWWEQMGAIRYPEAKELLVTADAGGSNSTKAHLWKLKLQDVADRTGLHIHVSHFPPGTSKWNKIEHRLFSFISINWRGHPLTTYETIVQLIAGTRTSKGLAVRAELDSDKYPLGIEGTEHAINGLKLERADFHGEWNYTLHPRSKEERAQHAAALGAKKPSRLGPHVQRREAWLALFREQQASGLAHVPFCKSKGISYGSYHSARTRLIGPLGYGGRVDSRSKKKWQELIRDQERSGTTRAAFCRAHGLDYQKFTGERRYLLGVIRREKRPKK
jgi:hypothetical protein